MNKPCVILVALMAMGTVAQAQQQQPWKEGEIEAEQVVIVKDRENELPPATRSYQKIPPQQPMQEVRTVTFRSSEPTLSLRPIQPGVRVLKMQQDPPSEYFQRYIKAGFGNYYSPLLDAHLSSPRQAAYVYHLNLRHESAATGPVDKRNSSWGETSLRASGTLIGKSARITGSGWYARDRFHFYGYDQAQPEPDRADIKQVYNRVGVKAELENINQEDLILKGSASVSRTSTNREVSENKAELEGNVNYTLSEMLGLHVNSTLLLSNYEDVVSNNRTLFRILPGFTTQFGALTVTGGFTFAWENDTAQNADKLHLFPRAEISVEPLANVRVFGGLRGDVLPVTYDFISQQNPFLNQQIPLLFTQNTIELYGGASASLAGGFGAAGGFSVAKLKNMYYFVNNYNATAPYDSSRFDVLYEQGNTAYVNVYGQMSFSRSEKFSTRVRADYYGYSPETLDEPWHQPSFKLEGDVKYNIYDKIYVDAEAFVLSGITARALGTEGGATTLNPVINLTLGGEYRFSPQATAFIRFHNILNKEFERFQNYPSRKLLVRIGATYAF